MGRTFTCLSLFPTLLPMVTGYDVYGNGYLDNVTMPGSTADARGLPNTPFTIDSNRLSDGVSSVSPLSSTSPSFPVYTNTTAPGVEERKAHFNFTEASAAEQGIALRGEGEFLRDTARYDLINSDSYDEASSAAPNATFPVWARTRWNPSYFMVQTGEQYRIEVKGEQYWIDGNIEVDANGYKVHYDATAKCFVANGVCRAYLKGSAPVILPPKGRWFQLMCGIGDFNRQLTVVALDMDRIMPLREDEFVGSVLAVGRNLTFTAKHTGELVCFANDNDGLRYNNAHYLNVTATRVSWPPNGTFDHNYMDYLAR